MEQNSSVTRSNVEPYMLGALYGLAVGDALGAPYEFQQRRSYIVSGQMEDSYIFMDEGKPLPAGTWTDDTSNALCLAATLNEEGSLDWKDFAQKLVAWYQNGYMSCIGYCFDIGNATRTALSTYINILDSSGSQRSKAPEFELSGSTKPSSSGNGSLMRLSPIPVFFFYSPAGDALAAAELQSRVTHGSQMCLESCRLSTLQLIGFMSISLGLNPLERKTRVLDPEFLLDGLDPNSLHFETREVTALRMGTWKTKTEEEIKTSGFVIHSHEAALWALWNTSSFEEGMLRLLPLGNDVDTVCAIYGQFAGALYGIDAIPVRWRSKLQKRDILEKEFDTLVRNAINRGHA